jgi:hypothetical protein
MFRSLVTVMMTCATLVACGVSTSNRYDYYPLTMDDSVMVRGCDGYTIGTIRVDRSDGSAMTCFPLKAGCNDTRDEGCGEGRFSTSFKAGRSAR